MKLILATDPGETINPLAQEYRARLEPYLPPKTPNVSAGRSHLTLTWAQAIDGQISLPGVHVAISGEQSLSMTHFLRSRHQALLVGVGTAEVDNPSLNCRYEVAEGTGEYIEQAHQPRPILLDPSGRWSCQADCKVLRLARTGVGKPPLWAVLGGNIAKIDQERLAAFYALGGEIMLLSPGTEAFDWDDFLTRLLADYSIMSVMVEGGGRVIRDLLERRNHRHIDTVVTTIGAMWLGQGAVSACPAKSREESHLDIGRLQDVTWLQMDHDVVLAGRFH
jgi:2,5-diamino-6-(ribosylamino)-4(3H)-pyrimidinone 5'-phosphate reductase